LVQWTWNFDNFLFVDVAVEDPVVPSLGGLIPILNLVTVVPGSGFRTGTIEAAAALDWAVVE
jgi:hypothetical protein